MNQTEIQRLKNELQNHENWHVRAHAAQFLGLHKGEGVYETLAKATKDPHPEVRSSAIGGLGNLGDARAIALLLSLLEYATQKPKEYWAYASVWSLGRIGDKQAVEPLINALKHPEVAMRLRASTALGDIGDHRAVQPLVNLLLNDEHMILRGNVASSLAKLQNVEAVEPLLSALYPELKNSIELRINDVSYLFRIKLFRAISQISFSLAKTLIPRTGSPRESLVAQRETANTKIVEALGRLGDKRATSTLIKILETKDGNVACSAAKALGQIGDDRAIDPLLNTLQHPWGRGWARSWAAEALGEFEDERILNPLLEALQHDEDISVRIAAAKGLMKYGDSLALPALDKAKAEDEGIDEDTGETVKWAATRARRYIRHINRRR